jgi:hypothetical protein
MEKGMAKKSVLVFIMVVFVIGGVFAAPEFKFSIGMGGYFSNDFGGGAHWKSGDWRIASETPNVGGGGFLFLDFTCAELSFGFFTGSQTIKNLWDYGSAGYTSEEKEYRITSFDINLMGKYPTITINSQFAVFPLYGFSYRHILDLKYKDTYTVDDYDDFNALWFRLGVGLDYFFAGNIFLRFGLTYGYRFPDNYDNNMVEFFDWYIREFEISNPDSSTARIAPRAGHGLEIKLAIGYRY